MNEIPHANNRRSERLQGPASLRGISVIVPVRNGRMHLPRCLEALARSEFSNFEVIVVDDCSTDETPQIVERYGARYLRTSRLMGPGAARNLGAQHARGKILVFVDADVVLPPEVLRVVDEDFSGDPELAAVFGSYDDDPAWPTFISQYKNLTHHYVHQMSSESATTFWAGCGAMRTAVFAEFGGFDGEQYAAPSIEDIALGLELAQHGRKIRLDKRLQVKHLKRWTLPSMLRADILYRAVPWTRLILSTRRLPRDLNLTSASRASSVLVGLLAGALLFLTLSLIRLTHFPSVPLLVFMAFLILLLFLLNWDVYRFFKRKRGWWFAARAVFVHWFYYLYSGVTFLVCAVIHLVSSRSSAARKVSMRE